MHPAQNQSSSSSLTMCSFLEYRGGHQHHHCNNGGGDIQEQEESLTFPILYLEFDVGEVFSLDDDDDNDILQEGIPCERIHNQEQMQQSDQAWCGASINDDDLSVSLASLEECSSLSSDDDSHRVCRRPRRTTGPLTTQKSKGYRSLARRKMVRRGIHFETDSIELATCPRTKIRPGASAPSNNSVNKYGTIL